MANRYELLAWIDQIPVALIREQRTNKITLEYTEDSQANWSFGEPILSVALPLTPDTRYPPQKTLAFLEGLLPEGEARTTLEQAFQVRRGDTFGLLEAIGRDCAGAVVFQSAEAPAPRASGGELRSLTESEVIAEIQNLGSCPLGASDEVRVSLAGLQDKLLLAKSASGEWMRPVDGEPSTHILKPQDERYDAMVANEALCLRIARKLGLTTIDVDVMNADGRPVLVVSRYDRRMTPEGNVVRIHQEDFCQALSIPPSHEAKYEAFGGPALRQVAEIVDRWTDGIEQLDQLVRAMTFNVVVGNADAHGKNYSLLHDPETGRRLAPLYDVVSTVYYREVLTKSGPKPVSRRLAMLINGVEDIDAVTIADLRSEVSRWPYSAERAQEIIEELLSSIESALVSSAEETIDLPEELVATIDRRRVALKNGLPAAGS